MGTGRRGDLVSVLAILSGAALGATFLETLVPAPSPAAAAPAPALPRLPFAGVAFHASSMGSYDAFEGDHGGRVVFDGGTLTVMLPVAHVLSTWGTLDDTRLLTLSLAVVEEGPEGWRIVRSGPPLPVDAGFADQPELWLRDVRLAVPDVTEDELRGRDLVVVHELRRPGAHGWETFWTYAPAGYDTLVRLFRWYHEDGC
ncbi:MAG: hypothetical protein AMXMBFR53_29900 [Gemmatimonadota bacterium]